MRHLHKGKKFNRSKDHRKALLRNLAVALIENKTINSTLPKCKALRPYVEKLMTMAKGATLHNRRILLSKLGNNENAVSELIKFTGDAVKERAGGYTRIVKAGYRHGDNAPMGIIQFVDFSIESIIPKPAQA